MQCPPPLHASPARSRAAERTTPIAIDGKLDDAAWQSATPVTEFTQTDPREGEPATERTEVRFMYDNGSLYVSAKMLDKLGRAGVKSNLVRRDVHHRRRVERRDPDSAQPASLPG